MLDRCNVACLIVVVSVRRVDGDNLRDRFAGAPTGNLATDVAIFDELIPMLESILPGIKLRVATLTCLTLSTQ